MKKWERSSQASETEVTREPEEAGDPHSSEDISGPQGSEEIRTPERSEETRSQGKTEETRGPEDKEGIEGPKETEIRDPEESEGIRALRDTEKTRGPGETRTPKENDIRGPEEFEGIRGPGETEDNREPEHTETKSLGKTEEIRGLGETWSPEEAESKGLEKSEKTRDAEEFKESRSPKETVVRGPEHSEGTRDPEEFKESRSPKETEVRGPEHSEGTRDPEEFKESRSPKETEVRGPEHSEGTRDPEEFKESRSPKETEVRGPEQSERTRDPEEFKESRSPKETVVRGPEHSEGTRDPDKSRETGTSRERKLRGSVRFEIQEPEKPESMTSDSSQDTRDPKETGDSEIPMEPRDLEEVNDMAEKGCLSLTKYFLFVFNIFFFVLGSLVLCFGLWILIDKNSFASYLGLSFIPLKVWSYVLAISGVLTGLLSLLGCLGALKEIRCLLGLYFSFLLVLFTTQITIGVLIYTQHSLLERKVKDIVLDIIENYHKYPDAYSTAENWDFVQFQLRCCGWTSPQDWLLASSLRSNGSAPIGSGKASTVSPTPNSDFLPSSQTSGQLLRVPCSCQNTSVIMSTPQSPADAPRASQPAAGPAARATVVSAPGMPVVLPGPGSPGIPARLRSGELCSMPADSGVYQEGCSRSVYTWLHNNLISIVGISLGLGLLEMAAVGLTLVLLPHARAWGSPLEGLEGESSAAGGCGTCSSGTPSSTWGRACGCASWGSQAPSRLPTMLGVMSLSMFLCRNLDHVYNKLSRYS